MLRSLLVTVGVALQAWQAGAADAQVLIDDVSFAPANWGSPQQLWYNNTTLAYTPASVPSCSSDYAAGLGGNAPVGAQILTRGNPLPGLQVRTAVIATSNERCGAYTTVYNQTTHNEAAAGGFCYYEVEYEHNSGERCTWQNGTFQFCNTGIAAVAGLVRQGSAIAFGSLISGPSATSTSAWATSVFRLTPAALTSAGIDPTLAMEFGAGMGNSTNVGQMGLAFYNDNTVDTFKVRRYVDPNNDGNCADAVLGTLPPAAPTIATPTEGSVTSDNTPNITGVCETGATVTIREGAATLCTAVCAASAYTCTSSALTDGLHSITATQVNGGGSSPASPVRNFTVDTVANAPTIATPTEGSVTSDNTPNITGVCETGATVTIREGAATLCTAVCAASAYTCTSSALTDGLHSITATQVDLAGNTSAASPVRNFTVNTAVPSAPTIEAPADGSSGVDATPTVSGTCQTGTLVTVSEGAQVLCTASCVAEAYACEASTLTVGDHTLTAIQTDDLGQDSPASAPVDYEVLADSDEDGLSDEAETEAGTDPTDADSDDDGVPDGDEPDWNADSDGDGLINALDADSDNDGLFDGTELGLGCGLPATDAAAGACIADADAGVTTTNPLDADTDDGGVRDGAEDANHNGVVDLGETDPNVGADDAGVVDTDGDGLSDAEEDFLGTDPNDADSDDDGVPDGQEANPGQDSDGDGLINGLDPDSDNDGLFDGTEQGLGCDNPATDASAGNCVADTDPATTTSPLNPDTDGGGVSDGDEDANGNGAVDPGERDPNDAGDDGDGPIVDEDRDGDGVADDDDNCPDVANAEQADQDADALGDACDADADGDGFVDTVGVAGGKLGCSAAQAPSGQLLGLVVLALVALRRRRAAA